jgi:hypothetical protein
VFDNKITKGYETDAYISHATCSYINCERVLFWIDNGCDDAGEDFKPTQCMKDCIIKNNVLKREENVNALNKY